MSGNPFRLSLHQKQPVVHHEATLSFPDAPTGRADASGQQKDTVIPASTPAKTTKKVRIESPSSFPPHPGFPTPSDSIAHRSSISNNIGPLPPASPTSSSDSLEDYEEYPLNADVGKHGEEDQTLMRNTKGMASAGGGTSGPIAGGIPANPFQKTLATIEPSVKSPLHREGPLERRTPDKTGAGNARASMDVDAFTRLLMTGNASPSASGASAVPQNPNVAGIKVESSSSTDTSSISRQSIFEPIQEAHSETPRTSYEMAASDDEDQTSLVGEPVKAEKKKPKPPPPKHRHGKLVASRTPQTVSFSDFSPSFVEPTTPPSSSSRSAISPSSIRSRNNSDLNKPLPPPPEPSYFPQETQHTSPAVSITPEPQIHPQSPSPEPASSSSIPQKRVPPAPPLARRHSTLRSNTQNRSRSNSSLTISSQLSDTPSPNDAGPHPLSTTSTYKPPPPPPPSRRHHGTNLANSLANSANTSAADFPSTTARSPSASTSTTTVTSPPPVPASRRSTFSSPPPSPSLGLARTSSVNSARHTSAPDPPTAPMAPPPPPPRRRGRGSGDSDGRASLDGQRPSASALALSSPEGSRRTSGEGRRSAEFHSYKPEREREGVNRRASQASESSLRYEYVGGPAEKPAEVGKEGGAGTEEEIQTTGDSAAILDDMERLQREVDALRERYGGV